MAVSVFSLFTGCAKFPSDSFRREPISAHARIRVGAHAGYLEPKSSTVPTPVLTLPPAPSALLPPSLTLNPLRARNCSNNGRGWACVSTCCAGQPLPRCFICLQQIGSLNPETEARRRQFDQLKKGAGSSSGSFGGSARARGSSAGGGGVGGGRGGGGMGYFNAKGLPHREHGAPQAALDLWWSWCNM